MKDLKCILLPIFKQLPPRKRTRSFFMIAVLFGLLCIYSCGDNLENVQDGEQIEDANSKYEEFKAYLLELEKSSTLDIPQNQDIFDNEKDGQSSLRSCSYDCDYDLADCGLSCDPPIPYSSTISIGGCVINYTFDLLRCYDINGNLIYNQVQNFNWWPDPGCTHFGVNTGYDINYTGGSKTAHDSYNNLVTGFILNHIEENIVYPLLAAEGATGYFGDIMTVVPKNCYAFCNADNLYKVCGEGCCIRRTTFIVEDGTITYELTENLSNSQLGNCGHNPILFSCATPSVCDEILDCDIDTFD